MSWHVAAASPRTAAVAVRPRLAEAAHELRPPITLRSLGAFSVQRGDEVVPAGAWQSRKARDLVKILVTRRGLPTTRDALIEALWPEQDPRKTANRLSVALSTARVVLDPARRFPPDRFIRADRYTVRLDREHVEVDVERFFEDAQAGLSLHRAGRLEEAAELLEAAEAAYAGDFLEEDLYEDWAVSLREEARAAHVAVCRALAELAEEPRTAAGYLRRVLERDPYDEQIHRELVSTLAASGALGQALRAYRGYAARMAEIGVRPASFPGATFSRL